MKDGDVTHVIYSDEAYHEDKYRSICLLSTDIATSQYLETKLKTVLKKSGINDEFKWKKVRSAKYRFCAIKLIDEIINTVKENKIRIDTLIWRPIKSPKKEKKNIIFQKMYYLLFKNVISRRWPKNTKWKIFPDKQSAINWKEVGEYLDNISLSDLELIKENNKWHIRFVKEFNIVGIEEIDSKQSVLSQVCDLFAGMASFSHLKYEKIILKNGQTELNERKNKHTPGIKEKAYVLEYFNNECKRNKLGVSLKSKKGLWTPNPKNPINFWVLEKPLPKIDSIEDKQLKLPKGS